MASVCTTYADMLAHLAHFPVSFCYDGTQTRGLGKAFTVLDRTHGSRGRHGTCTAIRLLHTPSGAEFRLETCVYPAYDACEWTLWIENTGDRETGVFSDLAAVDMTFIGHSPVMKGIAGDCGRDMYKPYAHDLHTDGPFGRESLSGRPSHGVFPYFNLEYGDGGAFIALG